MNEFYERLQKAIRSSSWVNLVKREGQTLVRVEPYVYAVTTDAIANGASSSKDFKFDSNSDFAVMYGSVSCIDSTGAGLPVGSLTVQMTDRNTQQSFFSEAIQANCFFGVASFPTIWPVPRVFKPSTRTTLVATNVSQQTGTTPWRFQFNLIGARLYYAG